ncbi:clavesin-1-like, partial [Centroberyx affinis]|uniref:clavesin-1-like n=1 Tax=Centroberyx affinis TaxID=166261 RepID=UPI003A5BC1BE
SLQDSFPARFGGIHFVNQPWYIHAMYTIIKPFLKDKTRKRIFLHGNNLNSLHQLLQPECLPSEFGGTLPPYDMGIWARTLLGPDYNDETEYTLTYDALHVRENCGGGGGGGGDREGMKR